MARIVKLTENDLERMVLETLNSLSEEKELLLEMPYQRSDYLVVVDSNARNAYIHFGKLFLYKDSTRNASNWVNEIVHNFTVPMLTAKVYVNNKAKAKVLVNGFINNFFGKNFSDYEEQMCNFCVQSIRDIENGAKKSGMLIPQYDDIDESIIKGKPIVVAFGNAVRQLSENCTDADAVQLLESTIRNEFNKAFDMNI